MPLEIVTVSTSTYVNATSTYTCEVCKAQKVVESQSVAACPPPSPSPPRSDPPKDWIGLISGEWFDRYDHLATWAAAKAKK